MKNEFSSRIVCFDLKCENRKIIAKHNNSGVEIQSPRFNINQISENEIKKKMWEVMKLAMKLFHINNERN